MSGTRLGLVRCEHCNRQFNAHSAARHIPWCAKQQSEVRKNKLSAEKRQALERYKWRISYKPSNKIVNTNHSQQQQQVFANNQKSKKFSINSSATLSSPSTGSVTSLGTNSVASTDVNQHQQHQQQQAARAGRKTPAFKSPSNMSQHRQQQQQQLKRSISSLTLTKQQGAACSVSSIKEQAASYLNERKGSGLSANSTATFTQAQNSSSRRHRTKSVNDLSANMSEIVETLAKRMDEIYAQNQMLLASISICDSNTKSAANRKSTLSLNSKLLAQNHSASDIDDASECDDGGLSIKCHHCRSSCVKEANYCHKCGCKVRSNSSSELAASPG